MSKSQKGINSPNEQKDEIESTSKKLLNRKTKRENNNSLESDNNFQTNLANEIRCSICLEYEKYSSKSCYKCNVCFSHFHLDCYNLFTFTGEESEKVSTENINNFVCMRCSEEKKNNITILCHLCGEHDGIMKKKDEQYIHHYCYVYFKDILEHLKNGKCKNCKIKNIPVLKCEYHGCKDKYHIKCALEKGIIISLPFLRGDDKSNETFNDKIPFFCEIHNKELIDNYAQLMSAMADSMKDKNKKPNDNNNENSNKNIPNINNNEEIMSLNKEKKDSNNNNINDNNNQEKIVYNNTNEGNKDNEEDKDNKSISSNSNIGENYGSNNDSQASEKTPVNNYSLDKGDNSINDKNSIMSNNITSNDNENSKHNNKESHNNKETNNNNEDMNVSVSKNNNEENKNNENKNENINERNENDKINNNKDEEVDDLIDIKMEVDEEDNKNMNKDKKNEENNENSNINKIEEEEEEDINNTSSKEKQSIENKNEIKQKEEYKIPEIKYEIIDLFDNFRKINEDYSFPGSFYKFHSI